MQKGVETNYSIKTLVQNGKPAEQGIGGILVAIKSGEWRKRQVCCNKSKATQRH